MLKKNKELDLTSSEEFDKSREYCIKEFIVRPSIFKRKITQGLYWTVFEKDVANQFMRDERWLLGVKFWDALKTIDHGITSDFNNKIGFNVNK